MAFGGKKETDEEEVTLRRKHRRQSSLGVSIRSEGIRDTQRRRASALSWGRGMDYDAVDELSTRTGRSRPSSWGPIGEFFFRDSLSFCDSERSPMSHHECNSQLKQKKNTHAQIDRTFEFLASKSASLQLYKRKNRTHRTLILSRYLDKTKIYRLHISFLCCLTASIRFIRI